jgi:hypothetical protein
MEDECRAMQKTHIKIAFAIGRGIDERLKGIRREPLPKALMDLLGRLSEAVEPESCTDTYRPLKSLRSSKSVS